MRRREIIIQIGHFHCLHWEKKKLMVAYMLGPFVAGRIKLVLRGFEHIMLSNTFHCSSLICQGDIAR